MEESKLDKTITDVAYILDVLIAYKRIVNTGCCHNCGCADLCKYLPGWGEPVRYNCPLYVHPWDTGEEMKERQDDK